MFSYKRHFRIVIHAETEVDGCRTGVARRLVILPAVQIEVSFASLEDLTHENSLADVAGYMAEAVE